MIWPFRKVYITQKWGVNKKIYSRFGFLGHNGIDLRLFDVAGNKSTTALVYAPHDGVVKERRNDLDGYGNYLKIESNKEGSILGHLKEFKVNINKIVKQGDLIAIADNTGWSTGSHLHWGYYRHPRDRQNGYGGIIDPTKYISPNGESMEISDQTKIDLKEHGTMEVQRIRSEFTAYKKNDKEYEQLKKTHETVKEDFKLEVEKAQEKAKTWKESHDKFLAEVSGTLGTTQDKEVVVVEIKNLVKKEDKLASIKDKRPISGDNWVISFIRAMKILFTRLEKEVK